MKQVLNLLFQAVPKRNQQNVRFFFRMSLFLVEQELIIRYLDGQVVQYAGNKHAWDLHTFCDTFFGISNRY